MAKYQKQTKYEMVKEFHDLINNSYQLSISDKNKTHIVKKNGYDSTFYEKERVYYDLKHHEIKLYVVLSDEYKYISPYHKSSGIYIESQLQCKTSECPLFDFINIYAEEFDGNIENAIKNIKFKTSFCGRCEEQGLMSSCNETGKQMYEHLLCALENLEANMYRDELNYYD